MVRSQCCDKTGLNKGTWTAEEDRKLKDYITRYGSWNWRQLPKFAGLSRCGKSCRLRWLNYLRPNIKRGNFSKEEEQIIINLRESLGNRWSAMASQLPGRSDNEIKNHWHTHLKKQLPISQLGDRKSKCKSSREKNISKAKTSSANLSTHVHILESSQFSPPPPLRPPPSSTELGGLTIAPVNCTSAVVESTDTSHSDISAETTTSFWTEPFFVDNYETTYDEGFLAPDSPMIGQDFVRSYGLYYENNNLNWYTY